MKSIGSFYGRVGVIHSCGGAKYHGRSVFFGVFKSVLYHFKGFLGRRGVKNGYSRELGKASCILLCLRGDGTGIVSRYDDHASLYAHICEAHQRIGRHVQTHLLHRHHSPRAAISCGSRDLHSRLFIYRPFRICSLVRISDDGFNDLRGRRSRISRNQIHSCRQRAQGDGAVAHYIFFAHLIILLRGSHRSFCFFVSFSIISQTDVNFYPIVKKTHGKPILNLNCYTKVTSFFE